MASIKTTECPKCKKPVLSHRVCTFCGTYKGREVIEIESKLDKKKRKESGKKSAKKKKKSAPDESAKGVEENK